uniref:Ubiquitin carboxyl-terminal hydrolase 24 n=1 Tax=Macaca nemestrina TaxID=9545 RepID=A0A2K6E181_MACNE
MESEEEQHMTTLLCMGFSDPATIRKALRLAKNDINEAVALLTNERPGLDYGGYEPMDSGGGPSPGPGGGPRGDGGGDGGGGPSRGGSTGGGGGFDPPPAYHEVVDAEKNDENGNCSGEGIEFPTTNLYELESRVLTDHWSIPYKREESLGKCLLASTYLARLGLSESDENCKRFMDRCMPEAFKKLLTSSAVHKWGTEIHEGIYNMLMLLIELVAERIKQDPIPIGLLGVLTMAFNPDNEYHFKNRMKVSQRNWAEVFGEGNMFAVSPVSAFQKEPHGWVVDLVNKFGELGGFAAIQAKLHSEDIELGAVSALIQPLGVCAEYLNSSVVQPMLDPVILTTIQDVRSVEEKDLKDKRLVSIPELLSAIKLLCMRFQPDLVTIVDDLRLDILLRMLKSPHFSAKMNSLKEVTKLIEDSTLSKSVKNAIDTDRLLDWLVENSVLSIALEGNIDQAQYCDRIKGIIELLGSKLSLDELTKIWKIQSGQSSTVIENIHTIIAAAAVKFNSDQLNHLFVLIQKSWETESDRVRQKLLSLIGRIGREARFETTSGKLQMLKAAIYVLWELAHLPTLPSSLIQQALEEHLTILSDAYAVKEAIKRSYIIKCIEDIKRPGEWSGLEKNKKDGFKSSQLNNPQFVWVVPALRQLHEITRSFIKQTYQKQDKSIIQDLKKNFEIVKLVTGSLIACHRLAAAVAGPGGLSSSTLVDGRYTYREYLEAHLKFLAFFLQEATLYLGWNRAKEIWECLVTGQDVCELDREMCFEWFTKGQHDLESDVQQQLFKEKILKLESYEITMNGFNLFKTFFENVNLCDHRLKRQGAQLYVEKLELIGMDFIWKIAMESPDEEIANEAIQLIINYSYINLNPRLKKDSVSLHKKFIADCYTRLEAASSALGGPTLTHAVTRATKMLTATAMPTVATSVQSEKYTTHIRHSQSSKSPSLSSKQQHQPSASSILESLFRSFAPGMSTFRVLYNLEVLSSKLMPTADDDMARSCAKSFCENFLKAGGLSLVVNVMQRDSIPSEVDYETRQGVYSICLQLARFLLVGQTMPTLLDEDLTKDGIEALSSRPFRNVSRQTSRQMSLCGTPEKSSYRQLSVSDRSSIRVEEIIPAARVAIQTMEVSDFTSTVACFMRLSWAAAAGRLDLVGSSQPIKESNSLCPAGIRNRLSSSGSNCSSGSEGEPVALHAGICVRQQSVSTKDSLIAGEALSLLVTCLQLRSQQLAPHCTCSKIDHIIGSKTLLSGRMEIVTISQTTENAFYFQISLLLVTETFLFFRLLSQCMEYFDLRCQLLDDLTTSEMEQLRISPATMLEDEITWLDNFEPNRTAECETSEADNILLAGHLRLIKTLLSLCGAEKEMLGSSLIKPLLDDFLFRASRIILNSHSPAGSAAISQQDFHPKCSTANSRLAAYEVLVMLADSSPSNLQIIIKELLSMHHQPDPALTKEFDYLPPVDSRSSSGFVGLRNGGATCYMNAVFQQLYMQPGLPESLLSVDDDTDNPDDSVFYQVQSLFGHLMESKLQYYVPENFWKIFKMWNKELYVREQQDAYEFFTSLIDQMDEYLKKMGRDQIFKNTFQGIYSDQKICKDCPHRYEREEAFMALNLGVTSCQSLEISLDQFVRGEVLEGSNAYYCEKCKEKRITVKRTCIKSLPSVLVIHLMRFGFDWESGRSIKYDEQIRFPWMLNMEPYTVSGMARQDSSSEVGENGRSMDQGGGGSPRKKVALTENYELVGVIVHSGQAHAGHYYSFIKDRRGCGKGKWYKFNDTVIEEFDLNDETLEYECFGGEYRPKVYDQTNPYTDVRRRYWNAYMLFYQRVSDQNSPVLPKKSRVSVVRQEAEDLSLSAPSSPEISPQSSPRPHRPNNDRLSILTKLVKKGEKKGLFVEKMPARIYQMVRDENLKFMKNRDVYSSDYFSFVLSLASLNATKLKHPYYPCMAKVSLQLAIQFLFQTYLRTKKKLRVDTEEWIATIEALLSKSFDACQWLVEYFISSEGRELIKIFLLECSVREVRVAVATILEKTLDSALFYQDKLKSLHQLLEVLLALLDKDVPENCKNCAQYFFLFNTFVQKQGIRAGDLLLRHSALRHMISFLLGASRQNNQIRRWSSAQAREFGNLHNTVALLVLHSDVSSQRNVAPGLFKQRPPISIAPSSPLLPLHEEVEALLFMSEGKPYLLEVMFALRELTGSLLALIEMVVYCCFCNEHFSFTMLHFIKNQLETAPPHELKNTFQLLHEILVIEDPIQVERVKFVFETENGLLALMHHSNHVDSSRCYQCVKFLVTLAQKCPAAKEYFKENSHHWSWAVQWLQKKMSEHYWTPQSNVSNETSTGKTFQRTISAQDTLAYATALLNEKEQSGSSNGSESSPANENGDRHLQQGSESPMMIGELRSDLDDVDP